MLEKLSPVIGGTKISLPEPTLCFACRLQRRLAFYNCRSLYRRTCDKTGKSIVSMISPDKPFRVYEKDFWFSDGWDPRDYGRMVDFSRPFFPQFREFLETVPLQSIAHIGPDNINSDYTNDNYKLKNCYLVFDGEQGEDCYYGHTFVMVKNCVDFLFMNRSELCFECVHCADSYDLKYSRFCSNCSGSWFLRDCIGCKDCFGCCNMRQKQYCVFNEQKTKEEYEEFLRTFQSDSFEATEAMRAKVETFFQGEPVKAIRGEQNVNSIGDNLQQCKNAYWCFDCNAQEDSRYCTDCLMSAKDCMDIHVWGDSQELCYESCVIGANSQRLIGDYYVSQGCTDVLYSLYCSHGCSQLFGCVGLKRAKHCILNTQYSEEEYVELVRKIIAHMRETGEWGEFFGTEHSCYGYNETMAQTFFPLTKEEVTKRGWRWSDYEVSVDAKKSVEANQLPDRTSDVSDDVCAWAIRCAETGKPFKIVSQELEFLRERKLPLPRKHPDRRHADRFAYKNPYHLYDRQCKQCGTGMQTTYSPDRPEIVYCEKCYLETVY